MINPMDEKRLKERNRSNFFKNIICFSEISSTNDYAKQMSDPEEGTVILADRQTAGKGRYKREWQNEKNADIAMSIILKSALKECSAQEITLIAAIAVKKCLGKLTDRKIYIKWPNDVLIGCKVNKHSYRSYGHAFRKLRIKRKFYSQGVLSRLKSCKKVCGILTEAVFMGNDLKFAVLGIGINVNSSSFPEELKENAASLYTETGSLYSREDILLALLEELEEAYANYLTKGFGFFIQEYKNACINIGRKIKAIYNNKEVLGECIDIDPYGKLVMKVQEDQLVYIQSGEVSVRGVYGYVR